MSFIYYLQQEAARCRHLAASVDDIDLSQRLHALAEQFENRAAALDPPAGHGGQQVADGGRAPFDPGSVASDGIGRAADDILDRMRTRT